MNIGRAAFAEADSAQGVLAQGESSETLKRQHNDISGMYTRRLPCALNIILGAVLCLSGCGR